MTACVKYQKLLSAMIDGELNGKRREAVIAHLAGCEVCRRWAEQWQALYEVMAQPTPSAPPFFAEKVRTRIAAQGRPALLPRAIQQALAPAAAAAGILLGVLLGFRLDFETRTSLQQESVISELFELDDAPLTTAYWYLAELSK